MMLSDLSWVPGEVVSIVVVVVSSLIVAAIDTSRRRKQAKLNSLKTILQPIYPRVTEIMIDTGYHEKLLTRPNLDITQLTTLEANIQKNRECIKKEYSKIVETGKDLELKKLAPDIEEKIVGICLDEDIQAILKNRAKLKDYADLTSSLHAKMRKLITQ